MRHMSEFSPDYLLMSEHNARQLLRTLSEIDDLRDEVAKRDAVIEAAITAVLKLDKQVGLELIRLRTNLL